MPSNSKSPLKSSKAPLTRGISAKQPNLQQVSKAAQGVAASMGKFVTAASKGVKSALVPTPGEKVVDAVKARAAKVSRKPKAEAVAQAAWPWPATKTADALAAEAAAKPRKVSAKVTAPVIPVDPDEAEALAAADAVSAGADWSLLYAPVIFSGENKPTNLKTLINTFSQIVGANNVGKSVVLVGFAGCGKTTVAAELAIALGLGVVIDDIYDAGSDIGGLEHPKGVLFITESVGAVRDSVKFGDLRVLHMSDIKSLGKPELPYQQDALQKASSIANLTTYQTEDRSSPYRAVWATQTPSLREIARALVDGPGGILTLDNEETYLLADGSRIVFPRVKFGASIAYICRANHGPEAVTLAESAVRLTGVAYTPTSALVQEATGFKRAVILDASDVPAELVTKLELFVSGLLHEFTTDHGITFNRNAEAVTDGKSESVNVPMTLADQAAASRIAAVRLEQNIVNQRERLGGEIRAYLLRRLNAFENRTGHVVSAVEVSRIATGLGGLGEVAHTGETVGHKVRNLVHITSASPADLRLRGPAKGDTSTVGE